MNGRKWISRHLSGPLTLTASRKDPVRTGQADSAANGTCREYTPSSPPPILQTRPHHFLRRGWRIAMSSLLPSKPPASVDAVRSIPAPFAQAGLKPRECGFGL